MVSQLVRPEYGWLYQSVILFPTCWVEGHLFATLIKHTHHTVLLDPFDSTTGGCRNPNIHEDENKYGRTSIQTRIDLLGLPTYHNSCSSQAKQDYTAVLYTGYSKQNDVPENGYLLWRKKQSWFSCKGCQCRAHTTENFVLYLSFLMKHHILQD